MRSRNWGWSRRPASPCSGQDADSSRLAGGGLEQRGELVLQVDLAVDDRRARCAPLGIATPRMTSLVTGVARLDGLERGRHDAQGRGPVDHARFLGIELLDDDLAAGRGAELVEQVEERLAERHHLRRDLLGEEDLDGDRVVELRGQVAADGR